MQGEIQMIKNILRKSYIALIFSLMCGLAYFGIVCNFIHMNTSNGSMLLGFFFFPAIICGAALIVLKAIRIYIEQENDKKLNILVIMHLFIMILSVLMVIGMFM